LVAVRGQEPDPTFDEALRLLVVQSEVEPW
jgi:hypothetical protein